MIGRHSAKKRLGAGTVASEGIGATLVLARDQAARTMTSRNEEWSQSRSSKNRGENDAGTTANVGIDEEVFCLSVIADVRDDVIHWDDFMELDEIDEEERLESFLGDDNSKSDNESVDDSVLQCYHYWDVGYENPLWLSVETFLAQGLDYTHVEAHGGPNGNGITDSSFDKVLDDETTDMSLVVLAAENAEMITSQGITGCGSYDVEMNTSPMTLAFVTPLALVTATTQKEEADYAYNLEGPDVDITLEQLAVAREVDDNTVIRWVPEPGGVYSIPHIVLPVIKMITCEEEILHDIPKWDNVICVLDAFSVSVESGKEKLTRDVIIVDESRGSMTHVSELNPNDNCLVNASETMEATGHADDENVSIADVGEIADIAEIAEIADVGGKPPGLPQQRLDKKAGVSATEDEAKANYYSPEKDHAVQQNQHTGYNLQLGEFEVATYESDMVDGLGRHETKNLDWLRLMKMIDKGLEGHSFDETKKTIGEGKSAL